MINGSYLPVREYAILKVDIVHGANSEIFLFIILCKGAWVLNRNMGLE